MSEKKIRDNYSYKELEYQMNTLSPLERIYNFCSLFGIKIENGEENIKTIKKLKNEYKQLRDTPDEFNKYFSGRGWIAFETMNFPLMVEAVGLAKNGRIDEAEERLVEYYSEENLRFLISRLKGIEEYRPRIALTYKALNDYLEGRYHSCIPIILMMIDGFVNDIEQKGFFASGTDMNVWDTISGHSSGLNALTGIFGKSRKRTTTDKIDIPYRHGIMHGRDLGYDNKNVAVKSWVALFAIADWANAVKSGKKNEVEKEFSPPSFKDSIKSIKESLEKMSANQIHRKLIDEWKPRNILIGNNIPERGIVSYYQARTPERTLIEFLDYLSNANYGKIAELTTKVYPSKEPLSKRAGRVREIFINKRLIDYRLLAIRDESAAITEIDACLTFDKGQVNKTFRLIYEDENCSPLVRGMENGSWRVLHNYSDLEYIEYSN